MSYAEENGIDVGKPSDDWTKVDRVWVNQQWKTAKGESIRICDMTNEHLYNAYKKFNDDRLEKEIIGRIFKKVCGL